jgi:hypothetical protein
MAWIAFASVPIMLVVMLAMGQLEARLLPRTPPEDGYGLDGLEPIRAAVALHWEIPAPAAEVDTVEAAAIDEIERIDEIDEIDDLDDLDGAIEDEKEARG